MSVLLASGCKKDDPEPTGAPGIPGGTGSGTSAFTATIDSASFSSNPLLVAGSNGSSAGLSFRAATGSTIANGDTISLVVTVTYTDPADFTVGHVFQGVNGPLADFAFGFFGRNTNSSGGIEAYSTNLAVNNAVVELTALDLVAKTWSATFSFNAKDDDTGSTYNITNGVFTDVEYD